MSSGVLLASEEEAATTTRPPVRLAVVDSHRLFRDCLAAALREDAAFGGVVATGDPGALSRRTAGEPDLANPENPADPAKLANLTDPAYPADVVLLGGTEGSRLLDLLRQARRRWPDAKVLVLGTEEGEAEALALLREGAKGYLFRDQSLGELRAAILEVAAGATACTPRIANLLFTRLAELGRERRRDERLEQLELTAREIEILRLIADGLKNQEIAARLYLSVHTVKNHVHNILERLGVKSRWSAVTLACEKGWLQARRRFPA